MKMNLPCSLLLCSLAAAGLLATGAEAAHLHQLKQMSLDELAATEISGASNRPENLHDTAAAVFLITADDIRRSGATTLPDLLRLVPGVNVARIGSSEWAVSVRGFNDQLANKLQVLVDGRSVYTPLFSGVFWDEQSMLLQDIERIEVIRGPGGSTWGANAVNGVINIITRPAASTLDSLVSATAGDRRFELAGRTGFSLGDNFHGRIYAKGFYERPLPLNSSTTSDDSLWKGGLVGFRADRETLDTALTLSGQFFREHITNRQPTSGHLLARWEQTDNDTSGHTLQAYLYHFDIGEWHTAVANATGSVTVADLNYQRQFVSYGAHRPTAGLNYHGVYHDATAYPPASFDDPQALNNVFSGFLQDDVSLSNHMVLTGGIKLEHNDYTGFEYQPSARLRWSDHDIGSFWCAVSRAVRTPSALEDTGTMQESLAPSPQTGNLPLYLTIKGNERLKAETVLAYEAGFRKHISPALGIELSTFLNYYDNLRTIDYGATTYQFSPPSPYPTAILSEGIVGNRMRARTYGVELSADYRPWDTVRIQASYSWLEILIREKAGNSFPASRDEERKSPRHQVGLSSSIDITSYLELDLQLRYVGALPALEVNEYLDADVRIGWQATKDLELSLVGKNLLHRGHREFGERPVAYSNAYQIPREVYLTLNWQF